MVITVQTAPATAKNANDA